MPAFRASNLAGQATVINTDGSADWLGPLTGGHYWPALIRTADGRWFVACYTRDGYESPPGRPPFAEVAAVDAAAWFEINRIGMPPEVIADLQDQVSPNATAPPSAVASSSDQTVPRVSSQEAIRRLIEGIEKANQSFDWNLTKRVLADRVRVPWSSAKRYFATDDNIKRAWRDYERGAKCPR